MNNEQNKKRYITPAMEEIALNHQASLLDGSAEEYDVVAFLDYLSESVYLCAHLFTS